MRYRILGTAAAEAWPAAFCTCQYCEEARHRGGPNIRMRSGSLIDDDLKIDFGPDTFAQMMRFGVHLHNIKTLVFTHQHKDHLVPDELYRAASPYAKPPVEKIDVYAPAPVIEILERAFNERACDIYELHLLEPHKPVITTQGDRILALPARHVEGATVLRITRGDKTVFHGHDSGIYFDETLDALEAEGTVDLVVMDCTMGNISGGFGGHMGVEGVEQMRDEMRKRGIVTDQTRVIATHFSHNGGMLHEELLGHFTPRGIDVAYDGMLIDL